MAPGDMHRMATHCHPPDTATETLRHSITSIFTCLFYFDKLVHEVNCELRLNILLKYNCTAYNRMQCSVQSIVHRLCHSPCMYCCYSLSISIERVLLLHSLLLPPTGLNLTLVKFNLHQQRDTSERKRERREKRKRKKVTLRSCGKKNQRTSAPSTR